MSIGNSILYAFLAVVQVLLTMLPGVYYGRRGLADGPFRRALSLLAYNLLLPALNLYNIAGQVSASTVLEYVPFVLNVLFGMFVGLALGCITNWLVGTPRHLRYHVIAASGFGNINSLPLLIAAAVCGQHSLPFLKSLGGQCTSAGFGYLAVGNIGMQIIGFPICTWLLRNRDGPLPIQASPSLTAASLPKAAGAADAAASRAGGTAGAAGTEGSEAASQDLSGFAPSAAFALTPLPSDHCAAGLECPPPSPASQSKAAEQQPAPACARFDIAITVGPGPAPAAAKTSPSACDGSSTGSKSSLAAAAEDTAAQQAQQAQQGAAWLRSMSLRRRQRVVLAFVIRDVLQMPSVGAVLGLLIGCVAPLKHLFFPSQTAALGFMTGAMQSIQQSYLFVASFINGAAIAKGPGRGTRSLGWKAMFSVVAIRFLLLPALGAVVVAGTVAAGLYLPPNPLFAFLMLLQYCVPASNQCQNLATMERNCEQEMGALVFWNYAAALVAVPAWMVGYLWMLGAFGLYSS